MQRSNISERQQFSLCSPASASVPSLTGRSSGHQHRHGFAIFMACVGALRTFGAPVPLTLGVRPSIFGTAVGQGFIHVMPRKHQ